MMFKALAVLLLGSIAGFFVPRWLQFMFTMALANGLVSLGSVLLMRGGVVAFGQGLMSACGTMLPPFDVCAWFAVSFCELLKDQLLVDVRFGCFW